MLDKMNFKIVKMDDGYSLTTPDDKMPLHCATLLETHNIINGIMGRETELEAQEMARVRSNLDE